MSGGDDMDTTRVGEKCYKAVFGSRTGRMAEDSVESANALFEMPDLLQTGLNALGAELGPLRTALHALHRVLAPL